MEARNALMRGVLIDSSGYPADLYEPIERARRLGARDNIEAFEWTWDVLCELHERELVRIYAFWIRPREPLSPNASIRGRLRAMFEDSTRHDWAYALQIEATAAGFDLARTYPRPLPLQFRGWGPGVSALVSRKVLGVTIWLDCPDPANGCWRRNRVRMPNVEDGANRLWLPRLPLSAIRGFVDTVGQYAVDRQRVDACWDFDGSSMGVALNKLAWTITLRLRLQDEEGEDVEREVSLLTSVDWLRRTVENSHAAITEWQRWFGVEGP